MSTPLLAEAGRYPVSRIRTARTEAVSTASIRVVAYVIAVLSSLLINFGHGLARADVAEAPRLSPVEIYAQFAPAVVGIRCRDDQFTYIGSGSIVDPNGLVLTSVTVAPAHCEDLEIYMSTGTVVPAEVLLTNDDREFSLLRITRSGEYPALDLGDSSDVGLGEASLALGNAFQSIQIDGQVAMAVGLVSGLYDLSMTRSNARYTGPIIETSAAINDYMDGGPLLNSDGQLVGVLGLNFSPERWLGTAVPINVLKPLFGDYRAWYSDRDRLDTQYLGVELYEAGAGVSERCQVRVERVFGGSPASRAGLQRGAVLVSVNERFVSNLGQFRTLIDEAGRGGRFQLLVRYPERESDPVGSSLLTVSLWQRF